jgi:hypothetical protein
VVLGEAAGLVAGDLVAAACVGTGVAVCGVAGAAADALYGGAAAGFSAALIGGSSSDIEDSTLEGALSGAVGGIIPRHMKEGR